MEADKKILHKIRNLLRRADPARNNNINEMIACGEIAQRLMDTYRISYEVAVGELDEIPDYVQEQVINYIDEKKDYFTTLQNPPVWVQGLMQIVAEHNNCEVYMANCQDKDDEGKQIKFSAFSIVGRMTDILVVEELFYWLLMQLIHISFKSSKGKDEQWANDFRIGAVAQLSEKFAALKKNPSTPEGITPEQLKGALVRIDAKKKEVDAMMEEITKKCLNPEERSKGASDGIAYASGYEAAKSMMIEKPKMLDNNSDRAKKLNQ